MEIKKGILAHDMRTFTDLNEAALRAKRLIDEEFSMGRQEQSFGGSLGKRKGNFPTSFGAPKGKNTGFRGGSSNKGGILGRQDQCKDPDVRIVGKEMRENVGTYSRNRWSLINQNVHTVK